MPSLQPVMPLLQHTPMKPPSLLGLYRSRELAATNRPLASLQPSTAPSQPLPPQSLRRPLFTHQTVSLFLDARGRHSLTSSLAQHTHSVPGTAIILAMSWILVRLTSSR
jgi:hypothetical protein